MEYGWIRFLNLEYWYCIVYSLFGGTCASVEPIDAGISVGTATGAVTAFSKVIGSAFLTLWGVYSTIAYSVSGLLVLGILGALGGLFYLRYLELSRYGQLPPEPEGAHRLRSRWQALLASAMSNDPKEWRESIMAADLLLGELLGNLGYRGSMTAERLRSVPEGAFVTLPAAWEAHRIRNFVAHPASDFILTQREAFRIMKLYEQVFEEFKFV